MKNENGFTLIELVVVIVILGILAAVAIPKYVDMQVSAKQAALKGAYGAIQGAVALAHAQALIQSKTAATGDTIQMEDKTVSLAFGYPDDSGQGIQYAANLSSDFVPTGGGSTGSTLTFTLGNLSNCIITYTPATATASPVVNMTDTCQ